ncbi:MULTISPECIES: trigger factor [unclassified Sulfurospirillum]|uniref:trigger factor n=1 Tax=unclassified Sulfurospirillum TaxID=2618290 RepID=UPI0005444BD6|nr:MULTISPECIES: trigger factor [unclassified Sulfurospirillum]KHG34169.1 MAG: trigger factor [Sulfurospirillum sp. MES]MCP3652911.1 trigger factor [Sulfurospirillum sp. DNRA8]MCR1811763.1 trigger factor [Sulfurospirillum sp. DNRA8]
MQIKVNRTNSANAAVEATISPALLQKKEEKMLASAASTMKVDGFRKGKVPTHLVKARFGKKIKEDAQTDALRELYSKALEALDVKAELVVGEPSFTKFEEKEGGLELVMKLSFRPTVNVEGYKECVPEYKAPKVTKKEISERLEKTLALVADLKTVEEKRAVKSGDFVVIDFEGFIDDVAFEGGKAENYTLEIGSHSFIPGFEDGIIGMKAGKSKDIEVTFPENYGKQELAGKLSVFKVTLKEIKVKDVPETPSEEMIKRLLPGVENPTLETLEEQIETEIRNEKLAKLFNEEVKPKFVETILEKIALDLPENIVDQEIDLQMRSVFGKLSEDEIKEYSSNPEKIKEKREEFRNDAEKSVKLTFIVDELARAEGINVSDQEVLQMIYFEAMQQGANPKEYLEFYEKQGVLPAIKMSIIEEKLFNKLFTKGK